MAAGIKTLKRISRPFPEQTRLLPLSDKSFTLLRPFTGQLKKQLFITLEKQLSWAVKTCFNRKKYDSSSDQKLKHQILRIKFLLEYKVLNYFMKFTSNQLPIFKKTTLTNIQSTVQPANQKILLQSQNNFICIRKLYSQYRLNPS